MTMQAAEGEMPLGVWLRRQREVRGWSGASRHAGWSRPAGTPYPAWTTWPAAPAAGNEATTSPRWCAGMTFSGRLNILQIYCGSDAE